MHIGILRYILGLYRDYRVYNGFYRDNGKENGNYRNYRGIMGVIFLLVKKLIHVEGFDSLVRTFTTSSKAPFTPRPSGPGLRKPYSCKPMLPTGDSRESGEGSVQ